MSHSFSDRSVQPHAPRRGTADIEEQRAWAGFYKRVGRDAALATEVLAQLDGDAEMKRRHLALYLSCRQSMRAHKARLARDKRIGQWPRLLVQLTLVRPTAFFSSVMRRTLHRCAAVLAEAMTARPHAAMATSKRGARPASGPVVEPATAQVRSLLGDAEFADAHARFQHQARMSQASDPEHGLEPRDASPAPAVQSGRR